MSAEETGRDLPDLAGRTLNAFTESASRTRDRDALMDSAFAALFDLYRASTPAQRQSPAGRKFTTGLAELLAGGNNPDRLGLYVVRSQTAAENGRHEGYRPACWRRSMLQILGEEFVPWTAVLRPRDIDAIARIDEALAEVAAEAGIATEEEVPAWVPRSHWWWWEPVRLRAEEDGDLPPEDAGPETDTVSEGARPEN